MTTTDSQRPLSLTPKGRSVDELPAKP
jgi:hypothetical protein